MYCTFYNLHPQHPRIYGYTLTCAGANLKHLRGNCCSSISGAREAVKSCIQVITWRQYVSAVSIVSILDQLFSCPVGTWRYACAFSNSSFASLRVSHEHPLYLTLEQGRTVSQMVWGGTSISGHCSITYEKAWLFLNFRKY